MIRVFLVDDHEIVRRGLAGLVDAQPDMEVVGEAATARQSLGRIEATTPDVAVLDVRLPDGSGIDVCRDVRSRLPSVACLILTAYDDDAAVSAAVLAGAAGYVLKDIGGSRLVDAIRAVASGRIILDSERRPAGEGPHPRARRRGSANGVTGPARTSDPPADRRRPDQSSDRGASGHRGEDREELRVVPAQQARAGAADAGRYLPARAPGRAATEVAGAP